MNATGRGRTEFDACDYCKRPFDVDTRYPVVVREDANGEVQLFSFCDESCQAAWDSENEGLS